VAAEMAAQEAKAFVLGDGLAKPSGFLTRATAAQADDVRPWATLEHHPTGNPLGFDSTDPSDSLIELVFKLRAGYRNDPSTAFLMNSQTLGYCRKLKDVNGNSLWHANLQQGTPSLLLGYPVLVDENMPNIEDGKTPIAFANWSRAYMIVDRTETTVIADKVTSPGWTKYYFARRVGGTVVDPRAIKLLKIGS
jgi:HK97 family phage major capsid protein